MTSTSAPILGLPMLLAVGLIFAADEFLEETGRYEAKAKPLNWGLSLAVIVTTAISATIWLVSLLVV